LAGSRCRPARPVPNFFRFPLPGQRDAATEDTLQSDDINMARQLQNWCDFFSIAVATF